MTDANSEFRIWMFRLNRACKDNQTLTLSPEDCAQVAAMLGGQQLRIMNLQRELRLQEEETQRKAKTLSQMETALEGVTIHGPDASAE